MYDKKKAIPCCWKYKSADPKSYVISGPTQLYLVEPTAGQVTPLEAVCEKTHLGGAE